MAGLSGLSWTPFQTAQGSTGYTAPGPDGKTYYHGPDGQVYLDAYGGEVHPGDVARDKVAGASVTGAGTGGSGSASGSNTTSPEYLSTLFPKGIPSTTASTVSPYASTADITKSISAADAPQFAQQNQALTEALANAGIVGGSTTGAVGALGDQQQQQLTAQIAPYIMHGYDQTQAGNEFNAGSQNANNQFNAANQIKAGEFDATAYNTEQQSLQGYQNQDYLTQLGLQGNLISAGAGAQSGSYQPIYQQPSPSSYSGLGTAIGNGFSPQATASSPDASSASAGSSSMWA